MRWLFKKIFQWSDPDGRRAILAIRDDCLADLAKNIYFSIKDNPQEWNEYIKNPTIDVKFFKLLNIEEYLKKPRNYKIVRSQDDDD